MVDDDTAELAAHLIDEGIIKRPTMDVCGQCGNMGDSYSWPFVDKRNIEDRIVLMCDECYCDWLEAYYG